MWYAVIGDHEKPRILARILEGASAGARERCRGAGIADEIRPDVEHRNSVVIRSAAALISPLPISSRCALWNR